MKKAFANIVKTGQGLEATLKGLRALAKKEVLVGIPQGPIREDSPLTNAQIGYIQEKGSPINNIPPRPFLIPGVESAQEGTIKYFRQAVTAAQKGNMDGLDRALNAAGMNGQNKVKAWIRDSTHFEPLKPNTLLLRARAGKTREKPLIDTGAMLRSVTYVVREK